MVWLQPPDPRRDLDDERKAAIWARRGFVAVCVARILSGLIAVIAVSSLVDDIQHAADTGNTDQTSASGWQALNFPVSIALLAGMVLVIMWSYKATTVASKLNYPARHKPLWAILGWIVPIINFWFPYQCVRDCLAPGNSERKTIGRWWTLYIVGAFAWFAAVVLSVFAGIAIALAIALPCIVISGLELQAALRVVDAIVADHADAIGRLTTTL
jgi:hypothetical protein